MQGDVIQLNVNARRYWFAFTDIESVVGENGVLDDYLPPPPLLHIVSFNIPEEILCFYASDFVWM